MESNLNTCTFCGKSFSKERTLQVHVCEPKRRHLQKSEKWVQNALMVFQRFYQIHQNSAKVKTYEDFCKSAYYNAFVKFGRYIMHVSPLYPDKYIDYIIGTCRGGSHEIRTDDDGLGRRAKRAVGRLFPVGQHTESGSTHTKW